MAYLPFGEYKRDVYVSLFEGLTFWNGRYSILNVILNGSIQYREIIVTNFDLSKPFLKLHHGNSTTKLLV